MTDFDDAFAPRPINTPRLDAAIERARRRAAAEREAQRPPMTETDFAVGDHKPRETVGDADD